VNQMAASNEERRVHRVLVARARKLSAPLVEGIASVGPVSSRREVHPSLGQFLAKLIVSQQLSARAARNIWKRAMFESGNARMELPAFTECRPDVVRHCGVSMNKVRALQSIRAAEMEGLLEEVQGKDLDLPSRISSLLGIRGVGPWTCDMTLIFYFHMPDIWPEGDTAVQRTFSKLIGRRSPTRTAQQFSPHRSSLALVMWHIADAAP